MSKSNKQQTRKRNRKSRNTRNKKTKGGCGCNKGVTYNKMKGGFGKASFQPFEHSSGQYYYPVNNYSSDPNMPTTMSSGRLSTPLLRGGKKRSTIRNKKMKGGELLLGNNHSNLPLSFGTTGGSMASINTLTGTQNINMNSFSQPIGSKFDTNNVPIV